ncbi:MAG: sigma-70 family RNA polymerase sigma factor [Deltaproteobacteria bacterium]|nr:sigma-70 family RNA polymerase sigma factor [Deltaproteobacteria bacterium]
MSGKPQVSEAQRRGAEAAELVARAKAGDTAAFDELVRKYRPRVYSLALTLTGQASDADDITQDAFLKAYHKLPEFEGRSEFFTWIYRITLHRALNAKRDRKRMRIVPLDDPRLLAAVAVDSHGNPERAAQLRDRYRALLEAFDQLSSLLAEEDARLLGRPRCRSRPDQATTHVGQCSLPPRKGADAAHAGGAFASCRRLIRSGGYLW